MMIRFGLLLCLFSFTFQATVPANLRTKSHPVIRTSQELDEDDFTEPVIRMVREKVLPHFKDQVQQEFLEKLQKTFRKEFNNPILDFDENQKEEMNGGIVLKEDQTKLDKLIYNIVENEQKEQNVQNEFELATLKMLQLKSKLDKKIDDFTLALQALKNVRRHVNSVYDMVQFGLRRHVDGMTQDSVKRVYLSELNSVNLRAEKALNFTMSN